MLRNQFPFQRLTPHEVHVDNLQRAVEFYTETFGFGLGDATNDSVTLDLGAKQTFRLSRRSANRQLTIETTQPLEKIIKTLEHHNLECYLADGLVPIGTKYPIADDHGVRKTFLHDSEGNTITLIERSV